MLTEKDFKQLEKQAVGLYGDLELEIIQEIAERIANVGYANTVVYNNAVILQEMGYLYEDIINSVAKYNETNASKIREIFEKAGIKSLNRDDAIYKLAGLQPKEISSALKNLMERRSQQTSFNLNALTGTIAKTSQTQFIDAINNAYLEVSTGVKSYSQSVTDIVKNISRKGAQVEYPSGYKLSVESAVRMNILTGVNQMSGELQLEHGRELGWDLYEVSAHGGARPEHAEWQGKVYTEKELYDKCGYGSVTGLCGVNCRHTFNPYYKGSTRTYSNKDLKSYRNATVKYNGKQISEYEASQIQRRMERQIRQNKKDIAGLQGLLTSTDINNEDLQIELKNIQNKMRVNNAKLNNFLDQTGFRKDNTRLVI